MSRPIRAFIHTQALRHNLTRARTYAPDAKLWAVVKANAYGHGIERVYEGLRGADGFALLDLDEAQRLRDLGWRGPILLIEGVFEQRDLELCSRLGLWHTVHCEEQIDMLATHKTHVGHRVFLKMNSGMNRLGFAPARYRAAWSRLNALPQVEEISHFTHFACADEDGGIETQLALFDAHTRDLPGERSLSNSAALLRQSPTAQVAPAGQTVATLSSDWMRPGVLLYGASPDFPAHTAQQWGLQPAMSLRSRVVGVQELQAGDRVGYGGHFRAEQPMRIGVVACGYADGYLRSSGSAGATPVLVDGQRTRVIGRVSMDLITVDLTHLPPSGMGSEVTLWGSSSQGHLLPIDEVAQSAGSIGYELMCALAARVPVEVVD